MIGNVKKYHYYSFVLLIFAISIQGVFPALPNIVLGISGFLMILVLTTNSSIRTSLFKNKFLWIYILIVLYLGYKFLFQGTLNDEFSNVMRYFIPFGVLSQGVIIPKERYENIFKVFILGVFLVVIVSAVDLFVFYLDQGEFNISTGKQVDQLIKGGRVYFSYAVSISCILSLYFTYNKKVISRLIYIINFVLLYFFLLLISARMVIIIITFISVLFLLKNLKFKYASIILLTLFFAISLMFFANPNLSNRFLYADKHRTLIEDFKVWEPRFVIWQCNYELLQDPDYSLFVGYESSKVIEDKLVACYPSKIEGNDEKAAYFLREKFNSHNQYFDFLLYGGFILLLLFVFFIYQLIKKNPLSQFQLYLLCFLFGILLIENVFHRQFGLYILGVIFFNLFAFRESVKST